MSLFYLALALFCGYLMGKNFENQSYVWAGVMFVCVLVNVLNAYRSL